MKLAGFNFTKISGEKKGTLMENIKIENKIDIKEIFEVKSDLLKTKEELIGVKFYYGLEFNPKYANLDFEGNLILSLESKKVKEILKDWKDKKIDDSFREPLFNVILQKCNIKALQLEENLSLPTHFKLPSIKLEISEKK